MHESVTRLASMSLALVTRTVLRCTSAWCRRRSVCTAYTQRGGAGEGRLFDLLLSGRKPNGGVVMTSTQSSDAV